MARIKVAYIGGGSTRAPGTMASFIHQGENFDGGEVVLIDLNQERLAIVKTLSEKMIKQRGLDIRISATTDRRAGLTDCDAVLTSYRPGGFEARYLDESIPLKHGVIGQETQGPGGFFMALRSIHVMQGIIEDMESVCPKARLFNYTNPINIVSQAVSTHTTIPIVSLCEGPIIFPRAVARSAYLDPDRLKSTMIGLNHGCWSVQHLYDGEDVMPLLAEGYQRKLTDPNASPHSIRILHLALTMGSIPADYFRYYYYRDENFAELSAKPLTRAQEIMKSMPDYWQHYREQAESKDPTLDPARSRGGIHELELAIDVMDAYYNDRQEVLPVNVPNKGAIADFPDDLVVEVPGFIDKQGITPLAQGHMPPQVVGLLQMLGEYQALTAEAAWSGCRVDGIRALASNPLVLSLTKAEAIYDDMAAAHRSYLPERLLQ
ncbi:MAG: glycoside hydrolase [Anaerolineae bacterium]|nr:glycoside hydrolase [Anaerolineae bacterium]